MGSDSQAGIASRGLFIGWEEVSLEEKYEGGLDTGGSSRRETDPLRQLCINVEFRMPPLQVGISRRSYSVRVWRFQGGLPVGEQGF